MKLWGYFQIYASIALLVWLVRILLQRKLHRRYTFFFVFVVLEISVAIALFLVYHKPAIYFWVYWISDVILTIATLIAIHEVFRDVFVWFYRSFWWFQLVFPGVMAVFFTTSIWFAISAPRVQPSPLTAVILSYVVIENTVYIGLLSLFVVLLALLGCHCSNYTFGIVRGFVVMAFGSLVCVGLQYALGGKCGLLLEFGPGSVFIGATILWLKAFIQPPVPDAPMLWATPAGKIGSHVKMQIRRLLQTEG